MTQTPTNPEPETTFKKILKGYSQSLPPEIIDELAQAAAEVYAHPTRDGWCCACDADIAFATHYIKDEPEYQALLEKEALKARAEELTHVQLEHGRYVTQTWFRTKPYSIKTRIEQLAAQLEQLGSK